MFHSPHNANGVTHAADDYTLNANPLRASWHGQRVTDWQDRTIAPNAQPGEPHDDSFSSCQRQGIVTTVNHEIIPRLLLAHWNYSATQRNRRHIGNDQLAALLDAVLTYNEISAYEILLRLQAQGFSRAALCLDLLTPVARKLDDLWQHDRCGFDQTNLAACLLQQLLRRLPAGLDASLQRSERGRRILLTTLPGDRHRLGISMVAEFFHQEGWEVWGGTTIAKRELADLVERKRFDAIGLSLNNRGRLPELATTLRQMRRTLRNRGAVYLVGGSVFSEQPYLATRVGADATAMDGQQAVATTDRLLTLLAAPGQ